MSSGWIGVDLDGTLAHYDGWRGASHIGEPVPAMLQRVREWVQSGAQVVIVTARVNPGDTDESRAAAQQARDAITAWTAKWVGRPLLATCSKSYGMLQLWDYRAVGVVRNEGVCAANDAVRKALQFLRDVGVSNTQLEVAALAAGYVVRYADGGGVTAGSDQRASSNATHGADVVTLTGPDPEPPAFATEEQLERAREEYCNTDEISVDDGALVSETDDGIWVQGWLWLSN